MYIGVHINIYTVLVYAHTYSIYPQRNKQVNISSIQVWCNSAMQVKWHSGELESSRVQPTMMMTTTSCPKRKKSLSSI